MDDSQPTSTPAPQPTSTPAPQPTSTPAPQPTSTPAPQPTSTPAPQPTSTPTPQPTATPTPQPTATPTPQPTATPVAAAGATNPPSDYRAPSATPEPAPSATPEPAPSATPEPDCEPGLFLWKGDGNCYPTPLGETPTPAEVCAFQIGTYWRLRGYPGCSISEEEYRALECAYDPLSRSCPDAETREEMIERLLCESGFTTCPGTASAD